MGFTDDKELKEYRDVMKPPEVDGFEDGFNWKAVAGALFRGFIVNGDMVGPIFFRKEVNVGDVVGGSYGGDRV